MLNIEAIEIDSILADPSTNIKKTQDELASVAAETDIVVLPEMFSTGYIADGQLAHQLAEPMDGPTMQHVREWAAQMGKAICGSFLAADGDDKLYNRAFFIEPSGEAYTYDKRHLFVLSHEADLITPGDKVPFVARFRGWNISMMVCYDLRFPCWGRNAGLKYDLMIVPANWPTKRSHPWQTLLSARAIENQAYYVGCNRSGCDDYGCYADLSRIMDYMGMSMGQRNRNRILASLDQEPLQKFRLAFPAWQSADNIEIKL